MVVHTCHINRYSTNNFRNQGSVAISIGKQLDGTSVLKTYFMFGKRSCSDYLTSTILQWSFTWVSVEEILIVNHT